MTVWSYIVRIQNAQSSVSRTNNTNSSLIAEPPSEAPGFTSLWTCSGTPDDGGLVFNIIADIILAALVILVTVIAWWFWLAKREENPFSNRLNNDDNESGEGCVNEHEKLVWYKSICQIWMTSDSLLELRQGVDGVRYIHLADSLLLTLTIITILSCAIVLPINLSGNREATTFGKFCITNLDPGSPLLWAHFILAPVYLLLILVMVWLYISELGAVKLDESELVSVIKNVDITWETDAFWEYFQALGMKEDVLDIQLGYDVSKLYQLSQKREEVSMLVTRYKDLQREDPEGDLTLNTGSWGSCCGEQVDGLEHYTAELDDVNIKLVAERSVAKTKRSDFAFVVWTNPGDCKSFINTHKLVNICKLKAMDDEQKFRSHSSWHVRQAPLHYDIAWDNMSTPRWLWWTRASIINLFLLVFVIIFTTPDMVITVFSFALIRMWEYMTSFYYVYFTILLLILLTNILPEIINWTCKLEKHRTKSGYFNWMLKKSFFYLLISLELLPLVGQISIVTGILKLFSGDKQGIFEVFQCMFAVHNSAFFCNLIIAAALVGRSIELLQIKGILIYIWEKNMAKTQREHRQILEKIKRDFNIGYNYAKLQSYLCLVISFSLICPIITLFGMLFLLLKYTVDKFLMLHRTRPCGSYSTSTHYTSAYFTVFSGIFLQVCMFVYGAVNIGLSDGKTVLSGVVLLLLLVFLLTKLGEVFYRSIFPSPASDRDFIIQPGSGESLRDMYIPPALELDCTRRVCRARRVYDKTQPRAMTSLAALLDRGVPTNYRSLGNSIVSRVGSLSAQSVASFISNRETKPQEPDDVTSESLSDVTVISTENRLSKEL